MATIYDSEADLPEQLQMLMADIRKRQQQWVNGVEGDIVHAQHEDMTIYGPFGGPVAHARDQLRKAQEAVRSQFKGGVGNVELIRAIESGDLAIFVLSEKTEVTFAGRPLPHPWNLRITEVYTNASGHWLRIHRHADPLDRRRPFDETLALLNPVRA